MARVKGATETDQAAHRFYDGRLWCMPVQAYCRGCGNGLDVAYHEERLYSVRCHRCGTVTLVKAYSPDDAAKIVSEPVAKFGRWDRPCRD